MFGRKGAANRVELLQERHRQVQPLVDDGRVVHLHPHSESKIPQSKPICILSPLIHDKDETFNYEKAQLALKEELHLPSMIPYWCANTEYIVGKYGVYTYRVEFNDERRLDYDNAVRRQLFSHRRILTIHRGAAFFMDGTLLLQAIDFIKSDIFRLNREVLRYGYYNKEDNWMANSVLSSVNLGSIVAFTDVNRILWNKGFKNGKRVLYEIVVGKELMSDDETNDIITNFGRDLAVFRKPALFQEILNIVPVIFVHSSEIASEDGVAMPLLILIGFGYGPLLAIHIPQRRTSPTSSVINTGLQVQKSLSNMMVEGVIGGYTDDGWRLGGVIWTTFEANQNFQILAALYPRLRTPRYIETQLLFHRVCDNTTTESSIEFVGMFTFGMELWTGQQTKEWDEARGHVANVSSEVVTQTVNKLLVIGKFLDIGLALGARVELDDLHVHPVDIANWIYRLELMYVTEEFDAEAVSQKSLLVLDQALKETKEAVGNAPWVSDPDENETRLEYINKDTIGRVRSMVLEARDTADITDLDYVVRVKLLIQGFNLNFRQSVTDWKNLVTELCGDNNDAITIMEALEVASRDGEPNPSYSQPQKPNVDPERRDYFETLEQATFASLRQHSAAFASIHEPEESGELPRLDTPTEADVRKMSTDEVWGCLKDICENTFTVIKGTPLDFLEPTKTNDTINLLIFQSAEGRFKQEADFYILCIRISGIAAWNMNPVAEGVMYPEAYVEEYQSVNLTPSTLKRVCRAAKVGQRQCLEIPKGKFLPVKKGTTTPHETQTSVQRLHFIVSKMQAAEKAFSRELGQGFSAMLRRTLATAPSTQRTRKLFHAYYAMERVIRLEGVSVGDEVYLLLQHGWENPAPEES